MLRSGEGGGSTTCNPLGPTTIQIVSMWNITYLWTRFLSIILTVTRTLNPVDRPTSLLYEGINTHYL